jgi:glucosamine--fructose-6-phosphate aminotransferase (isomerizing)
MAPRFIAEAWPQARQLALAAELSPAVRSILVCGCGDSHHAAVGLEQALAVCSGRAVRAAPSLAAGRFLLSRHVQRPEQLLLIAISASGEVARTLEAVELARRHGVHSLALTTQGESSLAKAAAGVLALPIPELPLTPGLLSYLAVLLMGYALAERWSQGPAGARLAQSIAELSARLEIWAAEQTASGRALAEQVDPLGPVLFLGSGPLYGSAMFAAAKVIESAGALAWAQDVEEWAHLEYFCNPADQPVWLLSAAGRAAEREQEVLAAAQAVGRRVAISRWAEQAGESPALREAVALLALWAGPVGFAEGLASRLGEQPFRGFGGGREPREGGGASRIRSSARWGQLPSSADWWV